MLPCKKGRRKKNKERGKWAAGCQMQQKKDKANWLLGVAKENKRCGQIGVGYVWC